MLITAWVMSIVKAYDIWTLVRSRLLLMKSFQIYHENLMLS